MRIEHLIHVQIHEDTDKKDGLWTPDKTLGTEVITNMQRMTSGKFSIANGGAYEALQLGDITDVKAFYIEADADFNMKLNGGSEILNIERADTTTGRKARFFMEGNISAVTIANPASSGTLTGRFVVYGDAA